MAKIVILGSAAAVNDADHDYTHFLIIGERGPVLVDCGSNPLGKIKNAGVDDEALQDVILTHFHPDHVAGLPNMLMHMWQLGRKAPMRFYGLHHCVNRVEDMMSAFNWETWPNFFPVAFNRVSERNNMPVMDSEEFRITSWPTDHFVPTIGLRIENKLTGKVLAYSCDTAPIPGIVELARNADLLIHEAAGEGLGHSSAKQAAEIATEAGAKSLHLIHYLVWNTDPTPLVAEAEAAFDGPVTLCEDLDIYEF